MVRVTGSIPGGGRGGNNGIFPLSHCIQSGSEAHQASYPMNTGGFYPGGKAARA